MQDIQARIAIERKVVRNLIRTAKKHGYSLKKVWDGYESLAITTEREALDAVFSVDESTILFKHPEEPKAHCAVIVLGNSGWDAIADSSMGERWDKVMDEAQDYADKFC